MRHDLLLLAPIFLTSTGCSNDSRSAYEIAAAESPVELQAGLYEIRLGGATVVELESGERTDQICLNSYDASQLPKDVLSKTIEPWEGCANLPDPPLGNAMSGARKCAERKVPMSAAYAGTHTANSFQIEGLVQQGKGETASIMRLGSGEFSIAGKRIGDCGL
jgi:hypothetical protein